MNSYVYHSLPGFRQFLDDEEDKERHLYHESGHGFIADQIESGSVRSMSFSRVTQSVTGVETGAMTLEQLYDVAVAGVLAEALRIRRMISPKHELNVQRMRALAEEIYRQVSRNPDPNYGFWVPVPMTGMPSTELAECDVADFFPQIRREDFTVEGIERALRDVAKAFNDRWPAVVDYAEPKRGQVA
jgi:hypothetical protein